MKIDFCINCSYSPTSSSSIFHDNFNSTVNMDHHSETREIVYEIPIQDPHGQQLQVSQTKVKSILFSIFKLNYLTPQHKLDKELILLGDVDIGLCDVCSPALISLFQNYTKFNLLGQKNSQLSKTITKLDEYIHRLQSLDTVPECHGHEETGHSIKAEFCSPCDDDYDLTEVTSMLGCDFHEEEEEGRDYSNIVVVEESISNPTVTMTQDSTTTTTTLPTQQPIVKIRRLTTSEIELATRRSSLPKISKKKRIGFHRRKRRQTSSRQSKLNPCDDVGTEDEKDPDFLLDSLSANKSVKSGRLKSPPTFQSIPEKSSGRKQLRIKRRRHDPALDNWKCFLCEESFEKSVDLSKHLPIHVRDNPKTCPVCSIDFTNLLDHFRVHCRVGNLPCPHCPKSFVTKLLRAKHLLSHCHTGHYTCSSCLQVFSSGDSLTLHELNCSSKYSHRNPCPSTTTCPNTYFSSGALLDEHMKKDHPGQKLFPCSSPPCPKHFALRRHLDRHVKFMHQDQQLMTCGKGCGRRFGVEKNLKTHEETCEGIQVFECPVCLKKFNSKCLLNWHAKAHAEKREMHPCDHPGCDKSYFHKSHLTYHQLTHIGDQPYCCEKCGRQFTTEKYLKSHSLIHEKNDKKYCCDKCAKTFLRPAGLNKHLRTHNEIRDYICDVCKKGYKYSESLRLHILLKHKEAQFVCQFCGAGFPYNFSLQKHLRTIHPEQDQRI